MRISRRRMLGSVSTLAATRLFAFNDAASYGVDALVNGTGMVRIPAGRFFMGSENGNPDERPRRRAEIRTPFEMSRYQITQSQWETVMTLPHSSRAGAPLVNAEGEEVTKDPSHFKGPMLPVDTVSWHDVQLFLARMNVRDPKFQYRLPTEAEWEYACRAGNQEEGLANLGAIAWYKANSEEHTHPVGGKQPNAWGLFDTHGNVSEWVHDWYGPDYYEGSPLADPPGPRTGSYRVFRGGSWLDAEKNCRASFRGFDLPINRAYNVGFRVVRTPAA